MCPSAAFAVADLPPASLRRADEAEDCYMIRFERARGMVRAVTRGFWTITEAETYVRDLGRFVDHARAVAGDPVRLLVDRRGVPVLAPDVAARFGRANAELYHDGDRVALLTDTSLMKMQIGRLLTHPGSRVFLTMIEAEAWLFA